MIEVFEYDTYYDISDAWLWYTQTFSEINTKAAMRHMLYPEEFLTVMNNKNIKKFVIKDIESKIVAMSVLTNHLGSWSLISPEYFEAKYPDLFLAGELWYIGFVGVSPTAPASSFRELLYAMHKYTKNGISFMDYCTYNAETRKLPMLAKYVMGQKDDTVGSYKEDSQEVWAIRFGSK